MASSPVRPRPSASSAEACSSAAPPPGTMPSSTAARVAATASSMRCLRSLSSVSVAAPTWITATPPASFASRSESFSRSQSESESAISRRICDTRASTSALSPPPSTSVVASLVTTARRTVPSTSRPASESLRPTSGLITVAPVAAARSSRNALRRSPKNGALTAADPQRLADGVDDDRGERLALEVLGHDQQRLARLHDLLQQREEVLDGADLVAVQQDVGVLQHGLHRLRVGDEVGREVALVELQALGDLQLGGEGRGLLDGDDAVLADPLHGLADEVADLLVARGDRADRGDALLAVHRGGVLAQHRGDLLGGGGHARTERGRVRAGGEVAQALGDEGLGEHGRRRRAVTGDVVGLGRGGLRELHAEVLERVVEVDLARDGDAVVGDRRTTEALAQHDVAPARTEGHLHHRGQLVDPALERAAGGLVERDLLGHCPSFRV